MGVPWFVKDEIKRLERAMERALVCGDAEMAEFYYRKIKRLQEEWKGLSK